MSKIRNAWNILKKIWNDWNLRSCILVSLCLQAILVLLAFLRKRTRSKLLHGLIWFAYLLADWIAPVAIGLISQSEGVGCKAKGNNKDLMAFWASFLLLHLGGPDTITSFALEDNEFWLRHLVGLILQVLATVYIFIESPPNNPWVENPKRSNSIHKTLTFAIDSESEGEKKPLDDMQLLQEAYLLFDKFKGLIVGLLFSSKEREWSREFFLTISSAAEAFRVIEWELNFMYEYLHTKVGVVRCPFGYFLRFISFTLTLGALGFFSIKDRHKFPDVCEFDIILTYVLLGGALGLEAISILMLILSDRTLLAVNNSWTKLIEKNFLKRRRWSKSVSQYDMISYCLNDRPTFVYRLAGYAGAGGVVEKMTILHYSHSETVYENLEEFIFEELRSKAKKASTISAARDASSQRGDWALLQTSPLAHGYCKLKWSIGEYQYAESLLIWHMATELLYIEDTKTSTGNDSDRETCKLLSDYMFYLLVMKPQMMAPVLGNWRMVFQDTCAEAKRFFHKNAMLIKAEACERILHVTEYRSVDVKGNVSKSVFFDGSILAKQLKELGIDKWMLMSRVWVELMSYAAINCRPNVHAQQPSKGGELLTFVWLLMNHLGFGSQFYEQKRQAKVKMVPRK
ncbi:hypothetical protein CFP56_032028 [Quercus suber]|uniref:DUF4220 domain-containing protein n=1 Tax=Quercus suber TaxID=58331 RepID=A0AAW0JI41_QUESU